MPMPSSTEPMQNDSLAIDVGSAGAMDPQRSGLAGSRLARTAHAGLPVARSIILSAAVADAVLHDDLRLTDVNFAETEAHAPQAVQALRHAWDVVGHGGLFPVIVERSEEWANHGSAKIESWHEFVDAVAEAVRGRAPVPLIVQARPARVTPVIVGREDPGGSSAISLRLAEDPGAGSLSLDGRGRRVATGVFETPRAWIRTLAERSSARRFHATIVEALDLYDRPVDLIVLVDEAGLDSISAVRPRP